MQRQDSCQGHTRTSDYTEFTSMQYLQGSLPNVPRPRPFSVVSNGHSSYIFMTYVPGVSLNTMWLGLNVEQKRFIVSTLNEILIEKRDHRCPPGKALGDIGGEGLQGWSATYSMLSRSNIQRNRVLLISFSQTPTLAGPFTSITGEDYGRLGTPQSFSHMVTYSLQMSWSRKEMMAITQ